MTPEGRKRIAAAQWLRWHPTPRRESVEARTVILNPDGTWVALAPCDAADALLARWVQSGEIVLATPGRVFFSR